MRIEGCHAHGQDLLAERIARLVLVTFSAFLRGNQANEQTFDCPEATTTCPDPTSQFRRNRYTFAGFDVVIRLPGAGSRMPSAIIR